MKNGCTHLYTLLALSLIILAGGCISDTPTRQHADTTQHQHHRYQQPAPPPDQKDGDLDDPEVIDRYNKLMDYKDKQAMTALKHEASVRGW